ncbi:DUF2231 domain-containing protein (plasmid) [Aliirhizobium terrae]|uniref:DUF2231 domain-containing protein n=1 Tax=Terrirhizobium terrae TaxID=2926709 RepID=UPI002577F2CD|nr:DUF2231 domain-containing protein [Rhizobium sp. CC-CFT758]WJH38048.1 DUF2231 domain-containing protein [Rhizobium sp. CC-CFT758]
MAVFSSPNRDSAAYPFQSIFVPFPFVCFSLALLTDIAYVMSSDIMWQNFSSWLLLAGLVLGGIGLLAGILDYLRPRTRPLRPAFATVLLYILILAIAVLNSFVHARDGWTAVMPYGLALSAVTFVLLLLAAAVSSRKYARLAWRV